MDTAGGTPEEDALSDAQAALNTVAIVFKRGAATRVDTLEKENAELKAKVAKLEHAVAAPALNHGPRDMEGFHQIFTMLEAPKPGKYLGSCFISYFVRDHLFKAAPGEMWQHVAESVGKKLFGMYEEKLKAESNYKDLLTQYMARVISAEGVDHITNGTHPEVFYTPEQITTLTEIAVEARRRM